MHALVGATLGLGLGLSLAGAVRSYYTAVIGSRLTNATVLMFFNHLLHLPARFHDEHRVGEVMSRFQDVTASLGTVTAALSTVLSGGLYLLLVPPLLLLLDWRLAAVAMLSLPLTITLTTISARVVRKYWKRSTEASADVSAVRVEALTHIRTVKTLALEGHIFRRVQNKVEEAQRLQLQATALGQLFGLANGLTAALGTAALTWYGWSLIIGGQLSLGEFIAFTAYAGYIYRPINQFVSLASSFQQSSVRFGRMFEYLERLPEQDPTATYTATRPIVKRLTGAMRVEDVSLAYTPDKPALIDVSIDLPQGSLTAVVGASGAGKSTLLRLLCGMEQPQRGTVLLDGVPFTQFPLVDVRRQIGVVWQEAALFQGSLWDNLTIGLDDADPCRVEEAVSICQLHDFVADLPAGYETPVGEWGATLSAGQRQRVAIARVLARDTPIVLLDEATANVDLATEAQLLANFVKWLQGRTVVMVTHRVATASQADRIAVLDGGRLVGLGGHGELLTSCDAYRGMHEATKEIPELRRLRVVSSRG